MYNPVKQLDIKVLLKVQNIFHLLSGISQPILGQKFPEKFAINGSFSLFFSTFFLSACFLSRRRGYRCPAIAQKSRPQYFYTNHRSNTLFSAVFLCQHPFCPSFLRIPTFLKNRQIYTPSRAL